MGKVKVSFSKFKAEFGQSQGLILAKSRFDFDFGQNQGLILVKSGFDFGSPLGNVVDGENVKKDVVFDEVNDVDEMDIVACAKTVGFVFTP